MVGKGEQVQGDRFRLFNSSEINLHDGLMLLGESSLEGVLKLSDVVVGLWKDRQDSLSSSDDSSFLDDSLVSFGEGTLDSSSSDELLNEEIIDLSSSEEFDGDIDHSCSGIHMFKIILEVSRSVNNSQWTNDSSVCSGKTVGQTQFSMGFSSLGTKEKNARHLPLLSRKNNMYKLSENESENYLTKSTGSTESIFSAFAPIKSTDSTASTESVRSKDNCSHSESSSANTLAVICKNASTELENIVKPLKVLTWTDALLKTWFSSTFPPVDIFLPGRNSYKKKSVDNAILCVIPDEGEFFSRIIIVEREGIEVILYQISEHLKTRTYNKNPKIEAYEMQRYKPLDEYPDHKKSTIVSVESQNNPQVIIVPIPGCNVDECNVNEPKTEKSNGDINIRCFSKKPNPERKKYLLSSTRMKAIIPLGEECNKSICKSSLLQISRKNASHSLHNQVIEAQVPFVLLRDTTSFSAKCKKRSLGTMNKNIIQWEKHHIQSKFSAGDDFCPSRILTALTSPFKDNIEFFDFDSMLFQYDHNVNSSHQDTKFYIITRKLTANSLRMVSIQPHVQNNESIINHLKQYALISHENMPRIQLRAKVKEHENWFTKIFDGGVNNNNRHLSANHNNDTLLNIYRCDGFAYKRKLNLSTIFYFTKTDLHFGTKENHDKSDFIRKSFSNKDQSGKKQKYDRYISKICSNKINGKECVSLSNPNEEQHGVMSCKKKNLKTTRRKNQGSMKNDYAHHCVADFSLTSPSSTSIGNKHSSLLGIEEYLRLPVADQVEGWNVLPIPDLQEASVNSSIFEDTDFFSRQTLTSHISNKAFAALEVPQLEIDELRENTIHSSFL